MTEVEKIHIEDIKSLPQTFMEHCVLQHQNHTDKHGEAPLSKAAVNNIKPEDVHTVLKRIMLADGYDFVFDTTKSKGIYLTDSHTGKAYIDLFSFFGSWPVGHNHPKMDDKEFRDEISHVAACNPSNSDIYTVQMAKFVATFERVVLPKEFKHAFFISGGTLAVENALKCAFDWKVRRNLAAGKGEKGSKVIHFMEAFHGRSGYCLSLTNTYDKNKVKFFPKFDWPRIDNPKITFPLEEGDHLKNVIEAEKKTVAAIEKILREDGDDVACIIIEPIQAEGGDNHFRKEFFSELRRLADQYQVLLIFDEVQTGVGLTGTMWAYEHTGIVPDLVCFGKKMQICGFISTGRVDEEPDNVFSVPSRINSTWGGNLSDMVRSRKLLEIIEEEKLVQNAAEVGKHLMEKLHELAKNNKDVVSNVRGVGLLAAFDLPTHEARNSLIDEAYKNGLIIIGCGAKSIRCRPHLTISKAEVDSVVDILGRSIKAVSSVKAQQPGK